MEKLLFATGLKHRPGQHVRRFLGLSRGADLSLLKKKYATWLMTDILRNLLALPAEMGLRLEIGPPGQPERRGALREAVESPDRGRFTVIGETEVRMPEGSRSFPTSCFYYLSGSGPGQRCVFELDLFDPKEQNYACPNEISIALAPTPASREFVDGFFSRLEDRLISHSVARGGAWGLEVDSDGDIMELKPLAVLARPCHRDLISPRIQQELETELFSFVDSRDALRQLGITARRGLLLAGDPGTGKTMTCRYIKERLPGHTMLVIDQRTFNALDQAFQAARRLAPAIVLIEEVDLIAQSRESNSRDLLLGQLLNQMDGIGPDEEIVTILTSNDHQSLERALVDRPGRIDHVVRFDTPSVDLRRLTLQSLTQGMLPDEAVASAARSTEGYTPALLHELVKKCVVHAAQRPGPLALTREDMDRALTDLGRREPGLRARTVSLIR